MNTKTDESFDLFRLSEILNVLWMPPQPVTPVQLRVNVLERRRCDHVVVSERLVPEVLAPSLITRRVYS